MASKRKLICVEPLKSRSEARSTLPFPSGDLLKSAIERFKVQLHFFFQIDFDFIKSSGVVFFLSPSAYGHELIRIFRPVGCSRNQQEPEAMRKDCDPEVADAHTSRSLNSNVSRLSPVLRDAALAY